MTASSPDKPKCHHRRHMTPSEFMTFDGIRGMAKENEFRVLVFFGRLSTLANHTNLSIEQNRLNIASLVKKGWLEFVERQRHKTSGKMGTNRYVVIDHETYVDSFEQCPCPPFKYDPETGDKIDKAGDEAAKLFSANMGLRRWAKKNKTMIAALAEAMASLTEDEKQECFGG